MKNRRRGQGAARVGFSFSQLGKRPMRNANHCMFAERGRISGEVRPYLRKDARRSLGEYSSCPTHVFYGTAFAHDRIVFMPV
jgi:hypothetical protein